MDRRVLGYTGSARSILATQCLIPASTAAQRANQPNGAPAPAAAPATPLPRALPGVTPGFQREPDDAQAKHIAGSAAALSQAEIDDPSAPPVRAA